VDRPRNRKGQFVKSRAPATRDDIAFIIIELDRTTGDVRLDAEFSTPAETFAALYRAYCGYESVFNPPAPDERRDDD
jgi:hypothetical protein